jgi:biopolymer transport protein ExbB
MNDPINSLLERYLINGGLMMTPLVLCSFLAVGYAMQGMIRLRRKRVMPPDLLAQARLASTPVARRSFIMSMRGASSPLGRSVWFALKDFIARDEAPDLAEVDALVEDATAQAADEMLDALGGLGTIYTVAPLLGLLGTVHGMIETFYHFGVSNEKSITALGGYISQALIATLWGLGIAIPTYMAMQWLQGKIRRYERMGLPVAARELIVTLYATSEEVAADGASPVGTFTAASRRSSETRPQAQA